LNYSKSELYNKYVCRDHFLDSDFIGLKKVRLTKSAIPQKYNSIDDHELKVTTPLKVYIKKNSNNANRIT